MHVTVLLEVLKNIKTVIFDFQDEIIDIIQYIYVFVFWETDSFLDFFFFTMASSSIFLSK